jgi:peptide-methionine (S)-S-oxide reductase
MFFGFRDPNKTRMTTADQALAGRAEAIVVPDTHVVLDSSTRGPWPEMEIAMFGLGCFWGAERKFWQLPGVVSTQVGYSAGFTPNPTYEEVCSGQTGHNEVVRVVYDPAKVEFGGVLKVFWESHNPTQGMQQGNDVGTQYRSGIYTYSEARRAQAVESRDRYGQVLASAGHPSITTEVVEASTFYFAEAYHQQYLHKNPGGYCGLGGTGVSCPTGLAGEGEQG